MSQNLPKRSFRNFLFYVILTISYLPVRTVETSSLPYNSIRPLFKQIREIFFGIYTLRSSLPGCEQLPNLACVKAFLRTSIFLDTFQGTFSPRN